MAMGSLTTSFLGAVQASVTVLLTIGFGVVARQFRIIRDSSAKDISRLCVKITLPALMISSVGSEVSMENVGRYAPILVWALFYTFASMGIGYVATRMFHFPAWTTPAVAFNNTTSLPLVLVQSLEATGILSRLIMGGDDSTSEAILRAKSYFLVNSVVGNAVTFALGPKLLDGDEAPDQDEDESKGRQDPPPPPPRESRDEEEEGVDEQTSLLPDAFNRRLDHVEQATRPPAHRAWQCLPSWLQTTLSYGYDFLVAPLNGAIIGIIVGLSPPLRRIFFNKPNAGGYFNATITSSVKNVGDLFAALQLVVVGSKLSGSLRNMKEGKDSGSVPWKPTLFVFFVRFLFWPLISIPLIWVLATKTHILSNDPILWFCLMMMPTGPPAIKLTALADVNDSSEHEKMSIAKFLTIAYLVSPLICFAVVGSLRASEAAMGSATN